MLHAHLLQRLRRTARWPADGPDCERGWSSTPSSGRGTCMAITQPGSPRRRRPIRAYRRSRRMRGPGAPAVAVSYELARDWRAHNSAPMLG